MEHRYAVLSFPPSEVDGAGYVEAVPCSWLTPTKSHCYWPPFKNPHKVTKCLKECTEPQKDWTISEARCLKLCFDYKTARQKSEEAQFTSDLESQDTDAERHRSRERRKRQYDSDESSDKSPQQRKKRKTNVKPPDMQTQACLFTPPPPPPSQTILIAKQNLLTPLALQLQQSATTPLALQHQQSVTTPLALQHQQSATTPLALQHQQSATTPLALQHQQSATTPLALQHQQSATALPIPSPPRESAFVTLEPSRPSTSTVHNGTDTPSDYRPLTEEAGKKLITLVMELKYEMKALQQQNQHIIDELLKGRSAGARQVPCTPKLPDGVSLPLQTFDQLAALDRKLLRSSEDRQQLVNYLGLIGGLTIKATTINILKALLMNDLARQFSFCGQRGKHSFKSLQLKEVLYDAVRANRLTRNGTNADIDNVTMEWLRTASDREGGRQSRGQPKERNSLNFSDAELNNSEI